MLTDHDAHAFERAAKDVTLVAHRGAGHSLHVDRAQDVLKTTIQFLNALE
jgi:hypothetical protein